MKKKLINRKDKAAAALSEGSDDASQQNNIPQTIVRPNPD